MLGVKLYAKRIPRSNSRKIPRCSLVPGSNSRKTCSRDALLTSQKISTTVDLRHAFVAQIVFDVLAAHVEERSCLAAMLPAFDKHTSLETAIKALEDPGLEIGEPCRQRCQLVATEIQVRQSSEQTKITRHRDQQVIFQKQRSETW